MTKWRKLAVFILLALISACHRAEEVPPNTFVIGVETGPAMLDPRLATDAASSKAFDLLFNGLVKRKEDFSILPDLAESWEIKDKLKYVFHLRKNVKFHDGSSFTSADVKAVYDFVLNPANKSPHRGTFKVIESIETPDDHTVIFNLKEKNAPFLGSLTFAIVKKGTETATEHPIGTGPFKLVKYKRDEQLVFVKHKDYFEGVPNLDGVIFKIVPDETVRTLELERGAVHTIMNPITPDLLPRFRKNENLKVVTQLGTNYSYLGFNMEDALTGDKNVREAIALAIDRKSIIEHILKGLAQPATGPISPASRFYEGDVKTYKRNLEKAKKILDEAGYKDPDGDGPQKRFTLRYSTSQNELRKRIAEVFQWQLSEAGIGIDIRSYEWGTFYADIKKGNFQMYSLTWVGIADPDIFKYIFHSSSMPPGGANRGRYRNLEIDKLTEMGAVTFGGERRDVYSKAQKILANDLPYVSLWYSVNVAVMNKRITGFTLAPDENLKSLKNVTIK